MRPSASSRRARRTGLRAWKKNLDTVCRGRVSLSDRQHAYRDERAILAAIVFLTVQDSTACPRSSQPYRSSHRTGSRFAAAGVTSGRSKPSHDHKDREQTTDESVKIHVSR